MVTQNDKDRVTKLMGENLLKGYTLLDEYCRVCPTPLMKRKNEDSFCVYCRDVKKKDSSNMDIEVETSTLTTSAAKTVDITTNHFAMTKSLEFVIESASRKLVWLSSSLQECTDLNQILQLNQIIQSTMDSLERASKLLNSQ